MAQAGAPKMLEAVTKYVVGFGRMHRGSVPRIALSIMTHMACPMGCVPAGRAHRGFVLCSLRGGPPVLLYIFPFAGCVGGLLGLLASLA